ncbi:MAG TPA: hypothetical protein VMR52_08515 [Dehalococcoidia bacterium]|nr:hypothetical protein [Dehalococcoidia bacterium]
MARRKDKRKQEEAVRARKTATGRSLLTVIAGGFVVVVMVVAVALTVVLTSGADNDSGSPPTGKTAIIVDQLSLTVPNPDFISEARATLTEAGYFVDYVPGEKVTVDLYRRLPDRGYDIILLRVHAGITTEVDAETGEKTGTEYVSLFTGEPYDETKYSSEQLNRLGAARYTEDSDPLFGIGPAFVEDAMEGDFDDALVVMMGCDGLRSQRTAEAFLDRGASAFVSWSQPISGPHTDMATELLLQRLLIEGKPVEQAVAETAAEVGPDPVYEGELRVLTG